KRSPLREFPMDGRKAPKIQSTGSPGATPRRTHAGLERSFPQKHNGKRQHVGPTGLSIPGEMASLCGIGSATPVRSIRLDHFQLTKALTEFWIWRAMFGNGAQIGTAPPVTGMQRTRQARGEPFKIRPVPHILTWRNHGLCAAEIRFGESG